MTGRAEDVQEKGLLLIERFQQGHLSRRAFLRQISVLGSAAFAASTVSACSRSSSQAPSDERLLEESLLSQEQFSILQLTHRHLFPADGNGPSADEIRATAYLQWVLFDENVDHEVRDYLFKGIRWVEEESQAVLKKPYASLNAEERERLLRHIESEGWGERWLSLILLYLFEALLCDPLYGGNPDGIGWKWLEHNPGYPRPSERTKYKSA